MSSIIPSTVILKYPRNDYKYNFTVFNRNEYSILLTMIPDLCMTYIKIILSTEITY